MLPHHRKVLEALEINTRPKGEMCVGFHTISLDCGELTIREVRRIVRHLARKGYAEYHKGLVTEDGEFAGAGYCITERGIALLDSMEVI